MRYLYTTEPDEGCHEIESGIFGRPVQTCDESKLMAKGWSLTVEAQRGKTDVRQAKKERQEEGQEVSAREELEKLYKEQFGKKPHHKMKDETILEKLKEAVGDDQG